MNIRASTPAAEHPLHRTTAKVTRESHLQQSALALRPGLVTPGPGIQLCPLTQNYSSSGDEMVEQDEVISLASQEDFFLSQEGVPALKRRRTLSIYEEEGTEQPGNGDAEDENTEDNRSTDDEEGALPLTFHTKEDLIRKLHSMQHLPRGEPCF